MPDTKTGKREWTQAELLAEAKRRFGDDPLDFAFICPTCGDVATIREFAEIRCAGRHRDGSECAGHGDASGQECIGRRLGALKGSAKAWKGRGCDWCAYGLFAGPWSIVMPDGRKASSFRLAEKPKETASA